MTDKTHTTPKARAMTVLLGGSTFGSIAVSSDEFRAIQRLYGFKPESPNEKPPPPPAPKREDFDLKRKYDDAVEKHEKALKLHASWEDPMALMQAGADRNAFRYAEADGLRIIAWLAKYVPTGEDPLKHIVQLAIECGLDVDPEDAEWATHEE